MKHHLQSFQQNLRGFDKIGYNDGNARKMSG